MRVENHIHITMNKTDVDKASNEAGVIVVDLPTGTTKAWIRIERNGQMAEVPIPPKAEEA